MTSLLIHIRCLLLFFILIQSVSLYEIYAYEQQQPVSSFKDELIPSLQYQNMEDEDTMNQNNNDNSELWQIKSKRSTIPQRRNNRPHWNPLIAAYKRCGELVSRPERESCFKEAVQMLFVYKLRK
ncbi:hypothetical protein I4U23_002504 [Adineta vaga]|nr:hypothetical protein I4U23_002504 [Adineta vaga]